MHITVLDRGTELAETVLRPPPRILRVVALMMAALLSAATAWAWFTRLDKIVTCPARVRVLSSPLKDFWSGGGHDLSFAIDGQVVSVAHEGDAITSGQPLIALDTQRIDNDIARIESQAAALRSELAAQEALARGLDAQRDRELQRAEEELAAARESSAGERDRLATDERRRLSDEELAAIDLEKQQQRVARIRGLADDGVVPQSDLNDALYQLRSAKARLDQSRVGMSDAAVRNALAQVAMQEKAVPLIRTQYDVRQRQAEVDVLRRRGDLDAIEKNLANLRLQQQQSAIRAPVDGVLSQCRIQVGQSVRAGQSVGTVVDHSGHRVDAAVAASDIGEVAVGMKVRIKLDTYDYQKFGTLTGRIDTIAPDADVVERTAYYIVRIALAHDELAGGARIKPGMTGTAEIIVSTDRVLRLMLNDLLEATSVDGK